MKDIILVEIKRNTIELVALAKGKIDDKKIELELLYNANADEKEPPYIVLARRRIWWHFVSFGMQKTFFDEAEAKKYFTSLREKYKLF